MAAAGGIGDDEKNADPAASALAPGVVDQLQAGRRATLLGPH
jgi:hypothetical protein